MKQKGLIRNISLITDIKAVKKTVKLHCFMLNTFDDVYLTENHSKIVLFSNDTYKVTVITSQNQTRGNRTEAGVITTNKGVYVTVESYLLKIIDNNSISLHDVISKRTGTD